VQKSAKDLEVEYSDSQDTDGFMHSELKKYMLKPILPDTA